MKYNGKLLENMKATFDALIAPIPLHMQAGLLFFAIPSSFARHVQATKDMQPTGTMAAIHKCSTSVVKTSCHVSAVVGNSSARLVFSFQCSADIPGWANFYPMAPDGTIAPPVSKGKSKGKTRCGRDRADYASQGFRIGDVTRFHLSWPNLNLPEVACVAIVLGKSIHQTKSDRRNQIKPLAKVSSLNLLVSFMPENLLQLESLQKVVDGLTRDKSTLLWTEGSKPTFQELMQKPTFFQYLVQHPNWVEETSVQSHAS